MNIKNLCLIFLVSILLFSLAGCSSNNKEQNTVSANKVSTELTINNNIVNTTQTNTTITNEIRVGAHDFDNEEEEISSFSTKLVGRNTARTRNIGITTSILNETIVENGSIFSFCNTVGEPTADKGYEKADSFDKNGNTVKTLGGGNCQVSTTLYNAVLKIPDLQVKERHEHSKDVHYIEKGKDAAVSYGSVDFKFQNNTGNTIKIYANSDLNNVNIRIVKIKNM